MLIFQFLSKMNHEYYMINNIHDIIKNNVMNGLACLTDIINYSSF
jgi:hypothetical protein